MGSEKRILWLLNHTTLRRFEVPLLVELGYEVFCPKIFQVGSGDGSASVTYEFDKTLTIPENVLDEMNKIDFYERVPEHIMEYMNQYFDIAIVHYFPNQFEMLVRNFKGVLVFQAFGLLEEKPYTEVIVDDLGISVLELAKKMKNRFFFAQSYPHLYKVECEFFRQHTIDMPLGLEGIGKPKHWTGGDSRFLFVLPRINTADYFRNIYLKYSKEFREMDYIIGGAQPIPVENDPHVAGFLSKEEYDRAINQSAAMFYHSQEKNHIHYHPFEAIRNGMPLVFMADGMMDLLGGKDLPGRCTTIDEAKKKLKALCAGDKVLSEKIRSTQDVLLKHFSYENCCEKWKKGMALVDEQVGKLKKQTQQKKKVAIILPQPYLGGVLDYTIRLVKCMLKGMAEGREQYNIVVGYPEDPAFKDKNYFKEIEQDGVSFRTFIWQEKSEAWATEALQLMDVPTQYAHDCCILNDGMRYFEDCDYLIFTADRFPGPLFTTKQYAVVAHDYIQRYCPELIGEVYEHSFIQAARCADRIYTTTQATREDCIQYAGVTEEHVVLTPLMFDLVDSPKALVYVRESDNQKDKKSKKLDVERENFFLWSTNMAVHKNHKRALEGLKEYYHKGGTFTCVVTGVNTDLLDAELDEKEYQSRMNPYILELRRIIEKDETLRANIIFKGNMPKNSYLSILQHAKFVFHPGYGDNGNGTVIDAACLGVPTVCSDYPAMRYIDEYADLHAHYFDPFDVEDIGDALQQAESQWEEYRKQLPDREQLKHCTIEGRYQEMYEIIRKTVEGLI